MAKGEVSASKAPQDGIDRMNRFWGDESWRQAAYAESKQTNLFFRPALEKQDNAAIVQAFQKRLKNVAGFEFVPDSPAHAKQQQRCCLLPILRIAKASRQENHH